MTHQIFVCLIDQGDTLCGDGYHGELSRDAWENTEACCSSSVDYLRDVVRCNEDVYWSKRKVVKKSPQLVDIYMELLESLQREDFLEKKYERCRCLGETEKYEGWKLNLIG